MTLLAACSGSSGGPETEVLPFEEVQDSEFEIELDPTNPSRGIFRVDTTEPMICAIVWGEDESFGTSTTRWTWPEPELWSTTPSFPRPSRAWSTSSWCRGPPPTELSTGAFVVWYWATVLVSGASVLGSNPFTRTIDEFTAQIAGIVAANRVLSGLVLALVGRVIWSRAGGGDGSTQSHQHAKQAPGDGPE